MIKLLLIEDDASFGFLIKSGLEEMIGGYEVRWAFNGKEGLDILSIFSPDVIVSDIMMPVMDGKEMVKQIKLWNRQIPIIFASAKIDSVDVVSGYEAGVDLYIKKPFDAEEIDAHIRSLLKTTQNQTNKTGETVYKIGNYTYYPLQYYLEYQSKRQQLSLLESKILTMLCENMGEVVLKADMLENYWNYEHYYNNKSRSLDVFIGKLRSYFLEDKTVSITTLKKIGFRLDVKQSS